MDILKGKYIELAIALWLLPVLQTFGQFSFSAEGYVFEKEYDSRMILTGFQPQSQIWDRQLLRVPASVIYEGENIPLLYNQGHLEDITYDAWPTIEFTINNDYTEKRIFKASIPGVSN